MPNYTDTTEDYIAYDSAFNRAIDDANTYGRTMQLRRCKEYGRTTYVVTFAVAEPRRFGVDAEGEFIEPGTPKRVSRVTHYEEQASR